MHPSPPPNPLVCRIHKAPNGIVRGLVTVPDTLSYVRGAFNKGRFRQGMRNGSPRIHIGQSQKDARLYRKLIVGCTRGYINNVTVVQTFAGGGNAYRAADADS